MLEAYYFADANAINAVLGTSEADHSDDVEEIRNPKAQLKKIAGDFDEIEHGKKIVAKLDVPHVLSRPETCAFLRSLFAWCCRAVGLGVTNAYCLDCGTYNILTGRQIANL